MDVNFDVTITNKFCQPRFFKNGLFSDGIMILHLHKHYVIKVIVAVDEIQAL